MYTTLEDIKNLTLDFGNVRKVKNGTAKFIPIRNKDKNVYIPFKNVTSGSRVKFGPYSDHKFGLLCFKSIPNADKNTAAFIKLLEAISEKYTNDLSKQVIQHYKLPDDTAVYNSWQNVLDEDETEHKLYRVAINSGKYIDIKTKEHLEVELDKLPIRRGTQLGGSLHIDSIVLSESGIGLSLSFTSVLGIRPKEYVPQAILDMIQEENN